MGLWGGYIDGKLHFQEVDDGWGGGINFRKAPAIFKSRAEARRQYQDVRAVKLDEDKRKR